MNPGDRVRIRAGAVVSRHVHASFGGGQRVVSETTTQARTVTVKYACGSQIEWVSSKGPAWCSVKDVEVKG